MPIEVKFQYPTPTPRPRPVGATVDPVATIDLTKNTISGGFREFFESTDPQNPAPVLNPKRVPFTVALTDGDMEAILGIVAQRAQEQSVLVPGSTPSVSTLPGSPPPASPEPAPAPPEPPLGGATGGGGSAGA